MEHYFILLEIPGGNELKFTNANKSPENFWPEAKKAIRNGQVKVICQRRDTGISEILRSYVQTADSFKTFILADLEMEPWEFNDIKAISDKVLQSIKNARGEMLIDACNDFQLVACEV